MSQDVVVPVTPCKLAQPSYGSISEEEDTAIHMGVTRQVTRHSPDNETKPFVVGDWLSDKAIIVWLHRKLYRKSVSQWHGLRQYIHCVPSKHQEEADTHAQVLGSQKDCWSCGHESLHVCD